MRYRREKSFRGQEAGGKWLSSDSWAVVGIFFLALVVRLVYLYESSDNPTFSSPVVDSMTYHRLARNLADGGQLATNYFWQGWLYPLFLAGLYFLSDNSIIVAKVVQMAVGGVTCALVYLLGRRIFNRRVGFGAGVMVAVYGPLIFFEGELLATGWAAFWSAALVLLFLETIAKKNIAMCFLLGLCGALSILTRATFLPFFGVCYVFLLYRFYGSSGGFRRMGMALVSGLAGFLVIAFPGAWLSWRFGGHFGLMPYSGGVNIYVGNNPDYCETVTARPGWEWQRITNIPTREGLQGDVWAGDRYFKQKVLDYARAEPLEFFGRLASKTLGFFSSREIGRNVDIYLFGKWSQFIHFSVWKQWGFGFPFGVLLPLTAVGMVYCRRELSAPVALFLFLYSLAIILVFVAARYRVVIVPVMSVYASAGLGALVGMLRGRQWGRISLAVVIMGGAVLAASLPGPFCEEQPNYEAELHYCLGYEKMQQDQVNEALVSFGKALELQDDIPSVHNLLGLILQGQGKIDEALVEFNKTLSLNSEYEVAYTNIGNIYLNRGKIDEAIGCYQKALRLNKVEPRAWGNLGLAYHRAGRVDEAIVHYRNSLALESGAPTVRRNLAIALLQSGQADEAMKHFSTLSKASPDDATAHYELAVLLWRQGKVQQAVEQYNEAVRLRSNYAEAHKGLADVLILEGRAVEAVRHYRSALAVKSDWVEVLNNLAWILATHKDATVRDAEEAIRLAQRACELTNYEKPPMLDTLAVAYAGAGRYDEAVETVTKAIELAESAGWEHTVGEYRKHLELYRARRPYSPTDVGE